MKKIVIPVAIIGIVIVITLGIGFSISMHKASDTAVATSVIPAVSPSPSSAATAAVTASPATASQRYKDGQYSAQGTYVSPGGNEQVNVTLTISGDNITAVSVAAGNNDHESQEYVAMFASGISQIVGGKPLAGSFDVSEVNGSSLTGIGFSQALQAIRTKATT